jgi:uncharacterized membrane protein
LTVETPIRTLAPLNYLLPVIGPLYIISARRQDTVALYHAYQSLALVVAAVVVPVIWGIVAWLLAWIPLAGPLLAAASFALVIATYLVIVIGWIQGIIAAFQTRIRPVPVFGGWGERFLY